MALRVANCNINATALFSLIPALAVQPNLRFLDVSNNPDLLSPESDALPLLRRYLPKMRELRKLALAHTGMSPDQAIALAEVLPEIPLLAHFSIVDNLQLSPSGKLAASSGAVEELAALYTALVAAIKVSKTIVRVDIDEPGADASSVIKMLAQRMLAYLLRNMEAGAVDWTLDALMSSREPAANPDPPPIKAAAADQDEEDDGPHSYDYDENGVWCEEEKYVVGGTGVVKALGVCLGNRSGNAHAQGLPPLQRSMSLNSLNMEPEEGPERANEMSKALLLRARTIKERIQPALHNAMHGQVEEIHHRTLRLCYPPFPFPDPRANYPPNRSSVVPRRNAA